MKLRSYHSKVLWLILAMYIASFSAWAAREGYYFPLDKIKPGMRGVGYTVVSGTKVEKFNVRFLNTLSGNGSVRNLIFVEVSGKILEPFGGIAAGMSGSPVFIDDQLVGAISYGFQNSDPRYGLVTPVEDMFRLWSYDREAGQQKLAWSKGSFLGTRGVVLGTSLHHPGWLSAQPVNMPLHISGVGERAYQHLTKVFASESLVPVRTPGGTYNSEKAQTPQMSPGSAVGVQLVRGDFQVTSIGTLTWISGDRFIAFGHPFMNRGNVDYYVTAAEIHKVMPSSLFPFKLGEPLGVIGRLSQDRGAGIAGHFGGEPLAVPVKVKVSETGRGAAEDFNFWVVHDENLFRGLSVAGGLEAVDRFLDRIGTGTSKVRVKVNGNGFDTIERTNVFFGQDIASASLKDFSKILELLLGNEYSAVRLSSIELEVQIDPVRKTARVVEASGTGNRKLLLGETLKLDVQIQPYRGKKEKIPVKITLPSDMPVGKYLLSIRGGNFQAAEEEKDDGKKVEEAYTGSNVKDLKGLINEFIAQPTNNMLVIEAFPLEGENAGDEKNAGEVPPSRQWTITTDYYLTGETQVNIEVTPQKAS